MKLQHRNGAASGMISAGVKIGGECAGDGSEGREGEVGGGVAGWGVDEASEDVDAGGEDAGGGLEVGEEGAGDGLVGERDTFLGLLIHLVDVVG